MLVVSQEAKDLKISDSRIFQSFHDSGIIVMTTAYRFWIRSDVNKRASPRKLAAIPGQCFVCIHLYLLVFTCILFIILSGIK